MEADGADITAWMGKPPGKPAEAEGSSTRSASTSASDSSPEEINYDGTPVKRRTVPVVLRDDQDSDDDPAHHQFTTSNNDETGEVMSRFQHNFFINVPKIDDDEKEEFQHLPGHFTVKKILSEFSEDRYLVKLASGEKQLVSYPGLLSSISESQSSKHVPSLSCYVDVL
jgi:hypothetical protein